MPEAVRGSKIIYLYRPYSTTTAPAAYVIAYVTENGRSVSFDADSTETKDGTLRTPAAPEIEITSSSLVKKGDTVLGTIEDAALANQLFDIWEVNTEEAGSTTGKYKGTYYQGYCTNFEIGSAADDFATLDLTFAINGKGAKGDCTVSSADIANADAYTFTDTVAIT